MSKIIVCVYAVKYVELFRPPPAPEKSINKFDDLLLVNFPAGRSLEVHIKVQVLMLK